MSNAGRSQGRRGPIGIVGDWFRWHRDRAIVAMLIAIGWVAIGVLLFEKIVSRAGSFWIDD